VKQVTPKKRFTSQKQAYPYQQTAYEFHTKYRWGYECRLLSQPDKIVAYLYVAPS
jgi:hypothetical protein